MIVKPLTEHHLEFLSLKGGCRGSSESTLVKMSNYWKSHAAAHIYIYIYLFNRPSSALQEIKREKRKIVPTCSPMSVERLGAQLVILLFR